MFDIFTEGNQTCQGCYQSSHAPDIDAHQQISIIFGELGQKYGWGNITDELTGYYAENQGVFLYNLLNFKITLVYFIKIV